MAERWIDIVVSPDGEVTIEAHGYQGEGCDAAIKRLTPPGASVLATHRKPEYHQGVTVGTRERNGAR